MKKILSVMMCMVLVGSFTTAPLKVSAQTANSDNAAQIQLLLQLLGLLQSMLAQLNAQNASNHTQVNQTTDSAEITNPESSKSSKLNCTYTSNSDDKLNTVGFNNHPETAQGCMASCTAVRDAKWGTSDTGYCHYTSKSGEVQLEFVPATLIQGEFFQGTKSGEVGHVRVYSKNFSDIETLEYSANCCKPTEGTLKTISKRGDGYVEFALDTYLGNANISGLKVRAVRSNGEKGDWIDIVE